jgi:hypothetical protein
VPPGDGTWPSREGSLDELQGLSGAAKHDSTGAGGLAREDARRRWCSLRVSSFDHTAVKHKSYPSKLRECRLVKRGPLQLLGLGRSLGSSRIFPDHGHTPEEQMFPVYSLFQSGFARRKIGDGSEDSICLLCFATVVCEPNDSGRSYLPANGETLASQAQDRFLLRMAPLPA